MVRIIGAILLGICCTAPFARAGGSRGTGNHGKAGSGTIFCAWKASISVRRVHGFFRDHDWKHDGTWRRHRGSAYLQVGQADEMEGIEGRGYLVTDLSTLETYGMSSGTCMRDTHPYFRSSPFAASKPGATVGAQFYRQRDGGLTFVPGGGSHYYGSQPRGNSSQDEILGGRGSAGFSGED